MIDERKSVLVDSRGERARWHLTLKLFLGFLSAAKVTPTCSCSLLYLPDGLRSETVA